MGRDLLHELGIDLCFSTAKMTWDNASIPMQSVDKLQLDYVDIFEQELLYIHDPITTDAERIQNIVDNKYCPADLRTIAKNCKLLSSKEQEKLYQLLNNFKNLFDGTLGNWKTDPIDLELKEKATKPFHSRPYPVPPIHKNRNSKRKFKD